MIRDKIRTKAYYDFIIKNKHLFENKLVLDVGAGTGILSIFALQAGARAVVAVEKGYMGHFIMANASRNGYGGDRIRVHHGYMDEMKEIPYPEGYPDEYRDGKVDGT